MKACRGDCHAFETCVLLLHNDHGGYSLRFFTCDISFVLSQTLLFLTILKNPYSFTILVRLNLSTESVSQLVVFFLS